MRIAITLQDQKYMITAQKLLLLLIVVFSSFISACTSQVPNSDPQEFDSDRSFQDLEYQVGLGPRVMGSQSHEQVREWLVSNHNDLGWDVDIQSTIFEGQDVHNIVAKREVNQDFPWIILGAHYDSRIFADRDPLPVNRTTPVPGANDGASGVSVLTELARVLPADLGANIWLVYFDAEDNGSIPGGEWILGSRAFVDSLEGSPDAVVIVDMVADRELNIHIEKNSDIKLTKEIWEVAASLGYEDVFINSPKYRLIDDHLPFIQAGIPAVDIIDFDYLYWHTVADTTDKVSPNSLKIVGEVILEWLTNKYGLNP
jgi:hypothetical protein